MKKTVALTIAIILVLLKYAGAQTNIFPSSGSVGIGTTSPASGTLLHVEGLARTQLLDFQEGGSLTGFIGRGALYTGGWSAFPDALTITFANRDFIIGGWKKTDGIWGGARFFLNSDNGNVGIGTTSPIHRLDVAGTINSTVSSGSNIFMTKSSGASLSFDDGTYTNVLIEANAASNKLEFWTNTNTNSGLVERMVINNNGNIGIGTTTPDGKVSVAENGSVLTLGTENIGFNRNYSDGKIYNNTKTAWQINARETDFSIEGFNGAFNQPFTILKNGNIGIGSPNPQTKLAVNGDVYAKKIKVTQAGWPDFVFEKDYVLKPLSEVEAYIKQHKHLPEVPSAEEVAKNDLDLGEMNKILLQKVEEYALYLIAMQKENNNQQAIIESLSKRVEILEKIKEQ